MDTSLKRIKAIDIHRGIIMSLMAFPHSREYSGLSYYKNYWWNKSVAWLGEMDINLWQQICINTVVAGGFFMIMGMGVYLLYHSRLKNGRTHKQICAYFLKRGTLLIFIQCTLLALFESLTSWKNFFYIGVLFGLGWCMILASLTIAFIHYLKTIKSWPFEYLIPLSLFFLITFTVQMRIDYIQHQLPSATVWDTFFILSGKVPYSFTTVIMDFTPLAWFPAVAFGLIIGHILTQHKKRAFPLLAIFSINFLIIWFFLRTAKLGGWISYGDFKLPLPQEPLNWMAYFSISKYPPSLSYFLWSFGINLFSIVSLYYMEKKSFFLLAWIEPLKLFGKCALFFYISHWFIYCALSLTLPEKCTTPTGVILFWLGGLIILYFLCKKFYRYKMTKPEDSLWRMF